MNDNRFVSGRGDDSASPGVNFGYRLPEQRRNIEAGFRRDIGGADLDVLKLDAL